MIIVSIVFGGIIISVLGAHCLGEWIDHLERMADKERAK
jgi:hypothetical protein